MLRLLVLALGYLLLALGVIGVLTPIPFGLFFLAIAMLVLIPVSPGTTRLLKRLRRNYPTIDRLMTATIRRVPAPYRRVLRRTDVSATGQRR